MEYHFLAFALKEVAYFWQHFQIFLINGEQENINQIVV